MTRKVFILLLCLALAFTAAACSAKPAEKPQDKPAEDTPAQKTAVAVAGIAGPTGVGLANMMAADFTSETNDYTFTVATAPDEVVGKFASGEVQIASVPTNLAATLNKKLNGDVQMLALNTAGVLYILENGDSVHSVADLKGKTVWSTGQGANPEYVLRYVLTRNGLDPDKDVTLEFLGENSELVAKLAKGEAEVALVPEPAATTVMTKNQNLRVALSMDEQWTALNTGSRLVMGCVVAKKSWVAENKAAVDAFLTEYKASIEAAAKDPDKTAALCEEKGIVAAAAIAKAAIPRCNLIFVAGQEMKATVEGYFQVLFDANPASVGGALPADDFYYAG